MTASFANTRLSRIATDYEGRAFDRIVCLAATKSVEQDTRCMLYLCQRCLASI